MYTVYGLHCTTMLEKQSLALPRSTLCRNSHFPLGSSRASICTYSCISAWGYLSVPKAIAFQWAPSLAQWWCNQWQYGKIAYLFLWHENAKCLSVHIVACNLNNHCNAKITKVNGVYIRPLSANTFKGLILAQVAIRGNQYLAKIMSKLLFSPFI